MLVQEALENNEVMVANEVKAHIKKFGGSIVNTTKKLFGSLVEADSFYPMRIKQILKGM